MASVSNPDGWSIGIAGTLNVALDKLLHSIKEELQQKNEQLVNMPLST